MFDLFVQRLFELRMTTPGKEDGIRPNAILMVKALLVGAVLSVALAAFSIILQPELSKYSLLVIYLM